MREHNLCRERCEELKSVILTRNSEKHSEGRQENGDDDQESVS